MMRILFLEASPEIKNSSQMVEIIASAMHVEKRRENINFKMKNNKKE
jgi:hypothetical protein